MSTVKMGSMLTPRQVASFMNELVTNSSFRAEFESNTKEILAKYGADIQESDIPELVKLPAMEKMQSAIGEYLESEKFGFPAQHAITSGFPLAFALAVVFVFIPTPAYRANHTLKVA
jgi:hypothetical protein